jgi:CubicO group peptidase (beta-lactamase class C family)
MSHRNKQIGSPLIQHGLFRGGLLVYLLVFVTQTIGAELTHGQPESVGMSSQRLDRIATAMQQYIDKGLTPGIETIIARKGKIIYHKVQGDKRVETGDPLSKNDIFRIASMTKPITSVALMLLWEEGHFQLNDPITKFLPQFTNIQVSTTSDASAETGQLVPPNRMITIRDLLTHTAGFANSYRGNRAAYREAMGPSRSSDNKELITRLSKIPLNYHPGTQWQYSIATDVVGHLVEVISGKSLDQFLKTRIFDPLDMPDTHFYLNPEKVSRLTSQYSPSEQNNRIKLRDPGSLKSRWVSGPKTLFRGAGGLVSTAQDYLRFQQMMLNGGWLGDTQLLSPSTVSLILENHTGDLPLWLPGPGMGFGLGYGIVVDRGAAATPLSEGAAYWGGAYCTLSWIDPEEALIGILLTQVRPYTHINVRQDFQVLTYQAISESYR